MKRASFVILLCLVLALLPAGCGAGQKEIIVPVPAATTIGGQKEQTTEVPASTAPATEAPATEAPTTEAPATEAPATEAPATETPVTEPPATEPPATEAPTTEEPATEAPTTEPPTTEARTGLSAVAAYYADYLRAHWDELDMTRHYDQFYYDVCASYRNVALFDVTGDGTPEMLLICHDPDSSNNVMCFRVITADANGAREMTKPNGDKIMNLFWDQTFPHDMTDAALFARGTTLYFYRKAVAGERDYSFTSEEFGRLTYQRDTGNLLWEIALYWEQKTTPSGTEILYQAEEKDIDEASYHSLKTQLLDSAGTCVFYGMPYYFSAPAYEEVNPDLADYIAVKPSDALAHLESVAEVPVPVAPTAETRTGLAAAAGDYAEYLRTHTYDLDLTQIPYADASYLNVAFYDVTGDGVPEMLLICYVPHEFLPTMCLRVITADGSGAHEMTKPNGDSLIKLFWDQTMAGGGSDTVLFARDSVLYFYRISFGDGLGSWEEETGRLARSDNGKNLYWDIALEYKWWAVDYQTEMFQYQAEEKDVAEETYYTLKESLLGSADTFIFYGMHGSMGKHAYDEVNTDFSDYIAMTVSEALDYLDSLR
nr:hypothetical protein [Lachnospiraceae bacterium]